MSGDHKAATPTLWKRLLPAASVRPGLLQIGDGDHQAGGHVDVRGGRNHARRLGGLEQHAHAGDDLAVEGAAGLSLRAVARDRNDVSGPGAADLFNLSLRDGVTGTVELIRNVSVQANHVRRVDNVLRKKT